MTATDELRRLLDVRGVEYETYDPPYPEFSTPTSDITTRWGNASYREWPNGTIRFSARGTTPEQAIAATLGPGTCKPVTYHDEYGWLRVNPGDYEEFWEPACACSECGELIPMRKFCPNCGRRVVEVDE